MAEVFNRSTSLWWNYGKRIAECLGQWCPNAQGAPQCGAVITCTPRSDRFISLRLSARPHDVVITQSYNPISTMWRIFLCVCFFILHLLMLDNPRFYLQSVAWFISDLWSPLAVTLITIIFAEQIRHFWWWLQMLWILVGFYSRFSIIWSFGIIWSFVSKWTLTQLVTYHSIRAYLCVLTLHAPVCIFTEL